MRLAHVQRGYNLTTTSIVILCIGILVTQAVSHTLTSYEQGRLDATINQAIELVEFADKARQLATGTTIDSDGVYHHTYPVLPTDASVTQFNTAYSVQAGVADLSPFETSYRINVNNHTAWVTVRVPIGGITPPGVGVVAVSSDETDLIAYPSRRKADKRLLNQAHSDKKSFYQEDRR